MVKGSERTGLKAGHGKGLIRGNVRRGVRSDMSPPVARRGRALHDPTLCERCGAVYSHKTWRIGPFAVPVDPAGARWTVCPACEQLDSGEFFGRVIIRGAYAGVNETAIRDRIRGATARAGYTQPMRRIVSFERREGRAPRAAWFEVLTTSQKLAHRIASELRRTFGGRVTYAWSDRDGELYATWQREDIPALPAPPRRRRIKGRGAKPAAPELEVQVRHTTLDPAWRDLIEKSLTRLCARHPGLLRVRVTLTHSGHHRHGAEEVAVLANLARATLRASKQEAGVPDAIHAVFLALGTELGRLRREPRRAPRVAGARPRPAGVSRRRR